MSATSAIVVRAASAADQAAFDAFVTGRSEADMLQLWAWGEAMAVAGQAPERLLATRGRDVVGVVLGQGMRLAAAGTRSPHGAIRVIREIVVPPFGLPASNGRRAPLLHHRFSTNLTP